MYVYIYIYIYTCAFTMYTYRRLQSARPCSDNLERQRFALDQFSSKVSPFLLFLLRNAFFYRVFLDARELFRELFAGPNKLITSASIAYVAS